MPENTGTLENLVLEFTKILRPLTEEFNAADAGALFVQLGIPLSPAQADSIGSALEQTRLKLDKLTETVEELIQAIKDEDTSAIISTAIDAVTEVKDVIESFVQVKDAIDGLTLPGVSNEEIQEIPERLLAFVIIQYFDNIPGLNEALEFTGVLKRELRNEGSTDPDAPQYYASTFQFKQIGNWMTSPGEQLGDLYDWGRNGFDGTDLFQKLEQIIARAGFPVLLDTSGPVPMLDLVVLTVQPKEDISPPGLLVTFHNPLSGEAVSFEEEEWVVNFEFGFDIPNEAELVVRPKGEVDLIPPGSTELEGRFFFEFIARRQNGNPFVLLGQVDGSRFEIKEFALSVDNRLSWDAGNGKADGEVIFRAGIKEGRVVIDTQSGDGFLSQILPDTKMEGFFDVALGISDKGEVYFDGSGGLEIWLPAHIDLGLIEFESIILGFLPKDGKLPINIGSNIKANLGPLKAVVENIGVTAEFSFPDGGGNLGPVEFGIGFKPPNGVGLSLDAGVVKGGGYLFFDFDREEYAGAIELVFSGFLSLKAIGLITTRMPDGSKGFSLLIIITAEFGSGIQLGFGFTLLGVGGLLGLNRTMRLEPLAEGVRTGAVEGIMFPTNVVENAPRIISDLRTFFPPEADIFLIGPLAKLGWGTPTLISLSLGIIIEIPGNIAILGVLKVVLPDEKAALLVLQVNFIGAIEFDKKRAWFFASMFGSRILFITLEGEMGLLIGWGADANFVVSVGGFHPRYTPPPLPFPNPKRIALNILDKSFARIRVEAYFSVTSNTVQFGAKAELFFGLSEFKIEGHLGFDALFQFSPFYFIIEFSTKVSVKVFGIGLFSISARGSLEGPTPYRVEGTGSISLLFFDIDVDFSVTWGEEEDTTLPPIEVLPIVEKEFQNLANWTASLPASNNLLVSLRKIEEEEGLVMHPVGALRISQRRIPLELTLDKVGSQAPSDANRFSVTAAAGLDKKAEAKERFATAQFQEFSDAEKLSLPAFEDQPAGLELSDAGGQYATGVAVKRVVRYEKIIIDSRKRLFLPFFAFAGRLFNHLLRGNAVTKSDISKHQQKLRQPFDDKIRLQQPGFTVAFNRDNTPVDGAAARFDSQAQAREYLQQRITENPELVDAVHVIPSTEVNTEAA